MPDCRVCSSLASVFPSFIIFQSILAPRGTYYRFPFLVFFMVFDIQL